MVRILNVLFEERVGGPQLRVLQVARGLRELGYETFVALPKGEPHFARLLANQGVSHRELELVRLRRSLDPRLHLRFAARFWPNVAELRRLIREQQIEVVHTNGLMNLQAAIAARCEGVPLVWHLNDIFTPRLLRKLLVPLVRRWADCIAVCARAVGECCFDDVQEVRDRLQLMYAPVDVGKFHPQADGSAGREEFGIAADSPVIGLVANVCPGKGHEYFLDAAYQIQRRYAHAKFLVVGARLENRRKFWNALQQQTARLQLERDVVFTGRRSGVPQLLRAMTVCVQASESEACPMAVLEASACGVPVVATNVGGTAEIVEDGETGILIEPRNSRQIAEAVLHLLASPELARRMGRAGAARMRRQFSLETCVEAHARMYDAVLRRARCAELAPARGTVGRPPVPPAPGSQTAVAEDEEHVRSRN
jgi:glycosyltransferase involved in cell wall biosynthesis